MVNNCVLIGRLCADPEMRTTQSGLAVTSFTLAVDRDHKGQDGQKQTDFIRIKTWRKLAEICAQNLQKGRLVAVEGRIEVRSYEAQDGSKRQAVEVVANNVQFLDYPKDGQQSTQQQVDRLRQDVEEVFGPGDDELPF